MISPEYLDESHVRIAMGSIHGGIYLKKLYPSGNKLEYIWPIAKLSPLTWPMEC